MKNIVIAGLILSTLAISCKKQIIEKEENSSVTNTSTQVKLGTGKARHIWIIYEYDGQTAKVVDIYCKLLGGTCSMPVTVTPNSIAPVIDIINTEDNLLIVQTFSDQESVLDNIFGADLVDQVINGSNTVKNLGTFAHENGDETFIQFYDGDDNIVATVPILL